MQQRRSPPTASRPRRARKTCPTCSPPARSPPRARSSAPCWPTRARAMSSSAQIVKDIRKRPARSWPTATTAMNASSCRAPAPSPSKRRLGSLCPAKRRQDAGGRQRRLWRPGGSRSWRGIGRPVVEDRQGRQRRTDGRGRRRGARCRHRHHAMSGSSTAKPPPASSIRLQEIASAVKARGKRIHGRCHVVLRRHPAQHGCDGHGRHGVVLQQVHRRRARLFLCAGEARAAGGLARASAIRSCSTSYEQWKGLEANGQFRFTPPTHALVAFHQALQGTCRSKVASPAAAPAMPAMPSVLINGMRDMGFSTLLNDNEAGPIIQTFLTPRDPNFNFEQFYEALRRAALPSIPAS